ncbi:hypothetical protein EVAR_8140_1 [Eumeta japonica]|uniref:Uncharacterized protein n=1 Tax=Eumeta variegata TaxID=151549 RepID=A0A4C1TT43_EUMVA|nr:hypothetical protein EVAR_8140_1 [Eumeta japonica]
MGGVGGLLRPTLAARRGRRGRRGGAGGAAGSSSAPRRVTSESDSNIHVISWTEDALSDVKAKTKLSTRMQYARFGDIASRGDNFLTQTQRNAPLASVAV